MKIIIDTSVIASAVQSNRGAAYLLLSTLPSERFTIALTVPLYLEYQDVLMRDKIMVDRYTRAEAIGFVQYLASVAHRQSIYFLWRPWLRDPKDDMVLEAALASGSKYIVTYNLKDFKNHGIEQSLGIEPVNPQQFLKIIGVLE